MEVPKINRIRTCSIKDQLRPLGRPAVSILTKPLKYSGSATRFLQKYLVRSFILILFGVTLVLFVGHVLTHEIICILAFIFYQSYFSPEFGKKIEEEKPLKGTIDDENKRKRKITRVLGVDFAPLDTSLVRRLETMAAALVSFSFLFAGTFFTALTIYMLLFTRFYFVPLFYMAWYVYDREAQDKGGRRCHWYRQWKLWKHVANYFPINLVKTSELSTERNYIFGYHPHGIMATGSFINFGTEGTNFSNLFPGITPHLMTLSMNFKFPFYRELILLYGIVSVTRKSLLHILNRKGTGNVAIVVVGGAQEALDAHRNEDVSLTLNTRRGFIRIALETGADLVPVFSFGENDTFEQSANPPGSKVREFQERTKKTLGFSTPLFHGRGLFQYTWGYVPYRSPITTVVGAPIRVEKVSEPTKEQISELHEEYTNALIKLFDDHKASAGVPDKTLTIC